MKLRVVDENGVAVDEPYEVRLPGWTEERFFAETPDQGFYEFRDGELIVHSAVNFDHQDLVFFLASLLRVFVSRKSLGRVVGGPAVLRVRENLLREPDIFFVSNERLDSVRRQYADAADFVIEVVSEGSRARDLQEKAGEYEAAGVGEYWVVDSAAREVLVHKLDRLDGLDKARYTVRKVTGGRLESAVVPGFWIDAEWLWQRPLPSEFDCLRELTG